MRILQIVTRPLPPTTYTETISDTTLIVAGALAALLVLGVGLFLWRRNARSK